MDQLHYTTRAKTCATQQANPGASAEPFATGAHCSDLDTSRLGEQSDQPHGQPLESFSHSESLPLDLQLYAALGWTTRQRYAFRCTISAVRFTFPIRDRASFGTTCGLHSSWSHHRRHASLSPRSHDGRTTHHVPGKDPPRYQTIGITPHLGTKVFTNLNSGGEGHYILWSTYFNQPCPTTRTEQIQFQSQWSKKKYGQTSCSEKSTKHFRT